MKHTVASFTATRILSDVNPGPSKGKFATQFAKQESACRIIASNSPAIIVKTVGKYSMPPAGMIKKLKQMVQKQSPVEQELPI